MPKIFIHSLKARLVSQPLEAMKCDLLVFQAFAFECVSTCERYRPAVTENNANDALDALSSLQSPTTNAIRGGQEAGLRTLRSLVPTA
jgi:hypothetical protein